ncbi:hypothetical protein BH18CHL2_BH18CHL2_02300 [soil metagenome]
MKDPPVKLNISAKTLGLVYAILAAIGGCSVCWRSRLCSP